VLAAVAELAGDDAAEGDAVAVEVPAHLVGRVEQVVERFALQREQLPRLGTRQVAAAGDAARQGQRVERVGGRHELPPGVSGHEEGEGRRRAVRHRFRLGMQMMTSTANVDSIATAYSGAGGRRSEGASPPAGWVCACAGRQQVAATRRGANQRSKRRHMVLSKLVSGPLHRSPLTKPPADQPALRKGSPPFHQGLPPEDPSRRSPPPPPLPFLAAAPFERRLSRTNCSTAPRTARAPQSQFSRWTRFSVQATASSLPSLSARHKPEYHISRVPIRLVRAIIHTRKSSSPASPPPRKHSSGSSQ